MLPILVDFIDQLRTVSVEDLAASAATLRPISDGETVVGEMEDDERRIMAILDRERGYIKALMIEFRKLHVDPEEHDDVRCNAMKAQLAEMEGRCDMLNKIMWSSVRDRLKIWQHSQIGVRADYKIVFNEKEEDEASDPMDMIGDVIGDALSKAFGGNATVIPLGGGRGKIPEILLKGLAASLGHKPNPVTDDGEPMPGFPGFPFRKKPDGGSGAN